MSKKNEQSLIRKGLSAIATGNATELKKYVQEALFSKVRRALDKKEKTLAKSMFEKNNSDKE